MKTILIIVLTIFLFNACKTTNNCIAKVYIEDNEIIVSGNYEAEVVKDTIVINGVIKSSTIILIRKL